VENILRKLGFTSRAKIAAWVTERRLSEKAQAPAR
jgi:DNA-binding NarL/FixJ family response regulator